MYLIEWLAPPRFAEPAPKSPSVVVDTTETSGPTLEEAMDRAKKLFPEARQKHPNIAGYRICKGGPPALFEWWSPASTGT